MSLLVPLGACLLISLGQGQQNQQPEIQATSSGNIVMRVRAGQQVSVEETDPFTGVINRSAVLTVAGYNEREVDSQERTNIEIGRVAFNLQSALTANMTMIESTLLSQIESERSTALAANERLAQQVTTLSRAVESLSEVYVTNVSCPEYSPLAQGSVTGHGRHPGSVRVLSCNTGYSLIGGMSTVVCLANGSWSDIGNSAACISSTAAPTSAPTPAPETVTCCVVADNYVFRAWADGQALAITTPTSTTATDFFIPRKIEFSETTEVLGLHTADGECGCSCGYWIIHCGTPSGRGPWNFVSPRYSVAQSMNNTYSQMWQAKTVAQTQPFNNAVSIGSAWLQASFANQTRAAGFVAPLTSGPFDPQQTLSRIYRSGLSVLRNFDRYQFSGNDCPAFTNGSSLADNTLSAASGMCAPPIYGRSPRRRVHWFVRIQPPRS